MATNSKRAKEPTSITSTGTRPFVVQRGEVLPHLGRSSNGAECVILVGGWDAEQGHHGVADDFSTVRPWRSTTVRARSKYRDITSRRDSGSSSSPSEVELVTSEKSTVTVLRTIPLRRPPPASRPHGSD